MCCVRPFHDSLLLYNIMILILFTFPSMLLVASRYILFSASILCSLVFTSVAFGACLEPDLKLPYLRRVYLQTVGKFVIKSAWVMHVCLPLTPLAFCPGFAVLARQSVYPWSTSEGVGP